MDLKCIKMCLQSHYGQNIGIIGIERQSNKMTTKKELVKETFIATILLNNELKVVEVVVGHYDSGNNTIDFNIKG